MYRRGIQFFGVGVRGGGEQQAGRNLVATPHGLTTRFDREGGCILVETSD